MQKIKEFETERLVLRQWKADDFPVFLEINSDPKVMEYFPSILNKNESDSMAEKISALIQEKGYGFWALELKSNNKFIGFTGLHTPTGDLPFSPCTEIGWRLAHQYWGNGFAFEAATTALKIGFEQLRLKEIVSFTTSTNLRSRAVMEKLGMTKCEEFEHPHLALNSVLRPHILYRMSFEKWKTVPGFGSVPD